MFTVQNAITWTENLVEGKGQNSYIEFACPASPVWSQTVFGVAWQCPVTTLNEV